MAAAVHFVRGRGMWPVERLVAGRGMRRRTVSR